VFETLQLRTQPQPTSPPHHPSLSAPILFKLGSVTDPILPNPLSNFHPPSPPQSKSTLLPNFSDFNSTLPPFPTNSRVINSNFKSTLLQISTPCALGHPTWPFPSASDQSFSFLSYYHMLSFCPLDSHSVSSFRFFRVFLIQTH
jgi:hypothetical protein